MPSDRCSLPQRVPSPTSSNRSNRKSPSNSQFGSGTRISKKEHENCKLAPRELIQKPRVDAGQKKRYELTKSYARLLETLPASTSTGSTSKIMLLDCATAHIQHLETVCEQLQTKLHEAESEIQQLRSAAEEPSSCLNCRRPGNGNIVPPNQPNSNVHVTPKSQPLRHSSRLNKPPPTSRDSQIYPPKIGPAILEDPNWTPARRIPIEEAVARGQITPQKAVQLRMSYKHDFGTPTKMPFGSFHTLATSSPARRVPRSPENGQRARLAPPVKPISHGMHSPKPASVRARVFK